MTATKPNRADMFVKQDIKFTGTMSYSKTKCSLENFVAIAQKHFLYNLCLQRPSTKKKNSP